MKHYRINEHNYELIEDNGDSFDLPEVTNKLTEYFEPYDYIIADWAYGKLRLKGFCEKKNSAYKPLNDINRKEKYIQENCAYGCKYFVLKKVA